MAPACSPYPCLAAAGSDLVVLDLDCDAYFCLPDVVERGDGETGARLNASGIAALQEVGYVLPSITAPGAIALPLGPPISRPTRDLRDLKPTPVRPGHLLFAGLALIDLARCGSDPTTARLLTLANPASRRARAPSDPVAVRDAAAVFSDLLPWLPFEGACLRRSALLIAFLRRQSLSARWVFGVRTWPFRAHCWVQSDDVCLNDDVERLAAYTPILAV